MGGVGTSLGMLGVVGVEGAGLSGCGWPGFGVPGTGGSGVRSCAMTRVFMVWCFVR